MTNERNETMARAAEVVADNGGMTIAKALRQGLRAEPWVSNSPGRPACVGICAIQIEPWTHTDESAKAFADAYNAGADHMRNALAAPAAAIEAREQEDDRYPMGDPDEYSEEEPYEAIAAREQKAAEEMSPEFTDTSRAALLWVLWHHQGGSCKVGQPIRFALGMGQHDHLNEHQIAEAKRWEALQPAARPNAARQEPLNYQKIDALWHEAASGSEGDLVEDFARAIEAAHGIDAPT